MSRSCGQHQHRSWRDLSGSLQYWHRHCMWAESSGNASSVTWVAVSRAARSGWCHQTLLAKGRLRSCDGLELNDVLTVESGLFARCCYGSQGQTHKPLPFVINSRSKEGPKKKLNGKPREVTALKPLFLRTVGHTDCTLRDKAKSDSTC